MLNHDMKWSLENIDEAKTSEQKESQNLYCTLFSTAQTRERGGCGECGRATADWL